LDSPPSKESWKRTVNSAVYGAWTSKLVNETKDMSSLQFLQTNKLKLGTIHPALRGASDVVTPQKIAICTKLMVGRYPLSSNHVTGRQGLDKCPLCHTETEDERHFLLTCSALQDVRSTHLRKILDYNKANGVTIDPDELLIQIIDPIGYFQNDKVNLELYHNLSLGLHNKRSKLLLKSETS
jgi:hypothetical protein